MGVPNHGYTQVFVEGRLRQLHILLMHTFNPSPLPGARLDIDHIDRDRSNNKLSNLRWTTHQINTLNTTSRGVYKAPKGKSWTIYPVRPDFPSVCSFEKKEDAEHEFFRRRKVKEDRLWAEFKHRCLVYREFDTGRRACLG